MQMNVNELRFQNGSKLVVSTRERGQVVWHSRLYVNNGETATLVVGEHVTRRGVEQWAARKLGPVLP